MVFDEAKLNLVALKTLKRSYFQTRLPCFYNEINTLVTLSRDDDFNPKIAKIIDFNFQGKFCSGKPVTYYTM